MKKIKRRYKKTDLIGLGAKGFWIIDIKNLVSKIPNYYFFEDLDNYIDAILDVISIITIDEVIHSITNLIHKDFIHNVYYNMHFYYKLIKNSDELKKIEKTDIFRYFSFMNSLINIKAYYDNNITEKIREEVIKIHKILEKSSNVRKLHLNQMLEKFLILNKDLQSYWHF